MERVRGLKAWPAGPVRANKRTPLKGLLVIIYAIELRLFMRRGRPCGLMMGDKIGGISTKK